MATLRAGNVRGFALLAGGATLLSLAAYVPAAAAAGGGGDAKVTVGSPVMTFPRNKQNEPAVAAAMDAAHPNVLAAGANEEVDLAPCQGSSCPFTPAVGTAGVYFSLDGGTSWRQPTYTGWTARNGTPHVGPIGTLPGYYQAGLVSDGDPALAFGPRRGPGGFSWANGTRLYYATLASGFPGRHTIPTGSEAIAVSRTDRVAAAVAGDSGAWAAPVIASKSLVKTTFSDKEALWVDNATTSRHFGAAYVCWTSFGATAAAPILLARSTDGGDHWSSPVTVARRRGTTFTGASFCTIRTDSTGRVFAGWEDGLAKGVAVQRLARSDDGGRTFTPPRIIAAAILPGRLDPAHVAVKDPRFTMDGLAGAREDAGLSLDIANGAPSGRGATDELVAAWSDGRLGLNSEIAPVVTSRNAGVTWSPFSNAAAAGDRPSYTSVAISPTGTDVYVAYDAFLTPWQRTTNSPRPMQGVVRHADVASSGHAGTFTTVHRGAAGDARGSSQNDLTSEFLGDYTYVIAGRTAATALWNDVRGAADCPAIDRYRASLTTGAPLAAPAPPTDCPPRFGNSDIYGGRYPDPTP